MSFCPSCGKPLGEGTANCVYCGGGVRSSAAAIVAAPQSSGVSVNTAGALVLMLGGFCLWAFLMYSAYQGKTFRIPIIGAHAPEQAGL